MDEVTFEDNSVIVKTALREKAITYLYEVGGELRSLIQRNSRRDTSQTAGSYQYKVVEGDLACHIGSDYDNAIWEEFGTGVHAIKGNGRKKSWVYQDRKGNWHRTKGKTANRPMIKSYEASKGKIKRRAEQLFGEIGNDK